MRNHSRIQLTARDSLSAAQRLQPARVSACWLKDNYRIRRPLEEATKLGQTMFVGEDPFLDPVKGDQLLLADIDPDTVHPEPPSC